MTSSLRGLVASFCIASATLGALHKSLSAQTVQHDTIDHGSDKGLVALLRERGNYKTFLDLVDRAGLMPTLTGLDVPTVRASIVGTGSGLFASGVLTLPDGIQIILGSPDETRSRENYSIVIAPTNAAFSRLSKKQFDSLTTDSVALRKMILAHLGHGSGNTSGNNSIKVTALDGTLLHVVRDTTRMIMVNNVPVVATYVFGDDGLAFGIDAIDLR